MNGCRVSKEFGEKSEHLYSSPFCQMKQRYFGLYMHGVRTALSRVGVVMRSVYVWLLGGVRVCVRVCMCVLEEFFLKYKITKYKFTTG